MTTPASRTPGGSPQPAAGPQPGWYLTSQGQPAYWDGAQWRPDVQPPAAAGGPVPAGQASAPVAASGPTPAGVAPSPAATAPQMAAPAPATAAPAVAKQGWWRAHRLPVIIVAAVLALALACGGIFLAWRHRTDTARGVYGDFRYPAALTTGDYDLQEPRLDCDWWVSFPLEDTAAQAGTDDGTVAAKVFTDANLSNEYPTQIGTAVNDSTVALRADSSQRVDNISDNLPTDGGGLYDPDAGMHESAEANTHVGQRFYGYGGYYYVRYVDAKGQSLDKPQVTYFTVKRDVSLPRVTGLRATMDEQGYLHASWDAVEGADGYDVFFRYRDTRPAPDGQGDTIMRIAQVEEPALDFSRYNGHLDDDGTPLSQNPYFTDYIVIGDSAEDVAQARLEASRGTGTVTTEDVTQYMPDSAHVRSVSILVRARQTDPYDSDSAKHSALTTLNISSMLGRMPLDTSMAMIDLRYGDRDTDDLKGIDRLRYDYVEYVLMADGTMARAVKIPDYDKAKKSTLTRLTTDDDGHVTNSTKVEYMTIPCTIPGTVLTSQLFFAADEFKSLEDFKTALEQVWQENSDSMPTGLLDTVQEDDSGVDWAALTRDNKVVDTMPTEEEMGGAKVSGSNELVRFIAANLIAGNRLMDVTDFLSDNDPGEEVSTAFDEAVYQNPLTLGAYDAQMILEHGDDGTYVLKVAYGTGFGGNELTESRDTYLAARDKVLDTVRDWQQDAPADKAEAVAYYHDRLAGAMTYDNAYYDSATNTANPNAIKAGTGTAANLVDAGDADDSIATVCSGYAQAMQLLMQQAGIDSYYVTGTVTVAAGANRSHAWNLIDTGDGFKATDVTWDDHDAGDGAGRDYLQVSVTEGEMGTRFYDADTVPERVLSAMVPSERIHPRS